MSPAGPKWVLEGALKLAEGEADKPLGEQQRRRRRVNLENLDRVLREHAAVYNALLAGRIDAHTADVQSANLVRHSNILAAIDYQKQLEALTRLLGVEIPPEFDPDVPGKLS